MLCEERAVELIPIFTESVEKRTCSDDFVRDSENKHVKCRSIDR